MKTMKQKNKKGMRLRDYFKKSGGSMHPAWGSFFKSSAGAGARVSFDLNWVPTLTNPKGEEKEKK